MSLFAGQKRRHLVRVGIACAVVARVIAQVAEFAFDTLDGPPWRPSRKQLLLFDKGHFDFQRNQVAVEVSDWFDRYLEPTERQSR